MVKYFVCFFSLLFTCFVNECLSQGRLHPGFVLMNKDTLRGFIYKASDAKSAKVCIFKVHLDSNVIEFYPKDIEAYKYENGKFYVSKHVNFRSGEKRKVFLEYLVNGIADLYYYKDDMNVHYFIENDNMELSELVNEKKYVHDSDKGKYYTSLNQHIGILKVAFKNCPEIYSNIDQVRLEHPSLIRITKLYHEKTCGPGNECIVYSNNEPFVKVKGGLIAGLSHMKLNFSSSRREFEFLTVENFEDNSGSYGMFLGFSVQSFNRVYLITEIYRYRFMFVGKEYHTPRSFELNEYVIPLYVRYYYPLTSFHPFVSLGVVNHFNANSGYQNEIPIVKFYFGYSGGVGVHYQLSEYLGFSLEGRYSVGKELENYVGINSSSHDLAVMFSIVFNN